MYFWACFFLFCAMYSSCPEEFKNALKIKSTNFSLGHHLARPAYKDSPKVDVALNDKCCWNFTTYGWHYGILICVYNFPNQVCDYERFGICHHDDQFSWEGEHQNSLGRNSWDLPMCQCQNHNDHDQISPWCDLEEKNKRIRSWLHCYKVLFCNNGQRV